MPYQCGMARDVLKVAYSADGVSIPSDFVREEYIIVYGDVERVTEFTIENDGLGGRVLKTKGVFSELCLIYRPAVDLSLGKFNASALGEINDWADRVDARIEALQRQADAAFMGGPCDELPDGDCLIPSTVDGKIEWLPADALAAKITPVQVDPASEIEAPETVEVLPMWNIKPSKRVTFSDWECDVDYCASDWPREREAFDWDMSWPDCDGVRFRSPVWFKTMIPVSWNGYCKPAHSWECGQILYPKRKNKTLSAAWS